MDRPYIRDGRLQAWGEGLNVGTWNVEGLTDSKLISLQKCMDLYGIHVLCLQEIRRPLSDYSITEEGYLFISSGGMEGAVEYAGVGFLVHPMIRSCVIHFCQLSNRMSSLKLRTSGGKVALISAYAPHAGRPFEERFGFFQQLCGFWRSISVNGPRICFGDFNSRLYCKLAGEEDHIGQFYFQNRMATLRPDLNRFLLLEFCACASVQIANTFVDLPLDKIVTYRELASKPMDAITPATFAQLDLVLIETKWKHRVISIQSTREVALASHHFLLYCQLDVRLEKKKHIGKNPGKDVGQLLQQEAAEEFSRSVVGSCGTCSNQVDDFSNMLTAAINEAHKNLPNQHHTPKQPWVSVQSLAYVDQRNEARRMGDFEGEKALTKLLKASCKADKGKMVARYLLQWVLARSEAIEETSENAARKTQKPGWQAG